MKYLEQEDLALLLSLLNAPRNEPGLRFEAMQLINAGFDTKADGLAGEIVDGHVLLFGALRVQDVTMHLTVTGWTVADGKTWQCSCVFGPSTDTTGFPPAARLSADARSAYDALEECLVPLVSWALHRHAFRHQHDQYVRLSHTLLEHYETESGLWLHGGMAGRSIEEIRE